MGYASKYTNIPPASGKALEGWVVVAYFPRAKKWFDGIVVLHVPMRGPQWYSVFHEEEDYHELWEVPDPEIFFRLERAGHHVVAVQPSMLPSLTRVQPSPNTARAITSLAHERRPTSARFTPQPGGDVSRFQQPLRSVEADVKPREAS